MAAALTVILALTLSAPGWSQVGGKDAGGCYTDQKWRRYCPEAVSPASASEAVKQAKARAKEKTLETYEAMEKARAKAKERTLDAHAAMKKALAAAGAKSSVTGRIPGGYWYIAENQDPGTEIE
jgi:hypothetical protein